MQRVAMDHFVADEACASPPAPVAARTRKSPAVLRMAFVALLVSGAMGCPSNTTTTPTEPSPPIVYTVAASGSVANALQGATILEVKVLLDGNVIQDLPFGTAVATAAYSASAAGVSFGSHTLSIRVPAQTVGSAIYSIGVTLQVTNAAGNTVFQSIMPVQSPTLTTSNSFDYTFTF